MNINMETRRGKQGKPLKLSLEKIAVYCQNKQLVASEMFEQTIHLPEKQMFRRKQTEM